MYNFLSRSVIVLLLLSVFSVSANAQQGGYRSIWLCDTCGSAMTNYVAYGNFAAKGVFGPDGSIFDDPFNGGTDWSKVQLPPLGGSIRIINPQGEAVRINFGIATDGHMLLDLETLKITVVLPNSVVV